MIRKPIADNQFYPGSKEKLDGSIEGLKPEKVSRCSAQGVIVPHAGYPFSGKVAVATIAKIFAPKNVIMLGPNHTGFGENFSLSNAGGWQTPYGVVRINHKLSEKIIDAGDYIKKDSLAHRAEHSLEVQLPIMQYFFKDFEIVPICCNISDVGTYQEVARQIKEGLADNLEDTLILASTDLTHYEPDEVARKKDRRVIESIVELNPEKLVSEVEQNNISMCGTAPVAITLFCLKDKLNKGEVVLYQTSGDATGDYSSVVGYTGITLR